MDIQEKKVLLIDVGVYFAITDDLVEYIWKKLQRFFRVTNTVEILDKQGVVIDSKLEFNPKATEEKVIEGLKRWAQWEKEKQTKEVKKK
jgi:hypothetical protein